MDLLFAEPKWIHLIWLVVAGTAVLFALDQKGSRDLDRFLSALMQQRLVSRPKRSRRLLRIAFLGLSGACLVVALMRPQSGLHYVHTPRVGARIMVCLDVSRSMLAEDVAPNRLRRAKAEIEDLLAFLDRDHVGLITFAGKATVLCPLTPDFGFLRLVLEWTGTHSVSRGGTNLESPIRKAVAGFRGQSDLSRAIILITDGEDHDSFALEAAKEAAERGIRIIAIGFGDEAGSQVLVTDARTGARTLLLDGNNKPVMTKLDGELLRKIALETGGVYVPAGTGVLDLKSIYDAHIAPLTRGRLDDRGRLVKQERYQWAVLLALVCLIAAATVVSGRPAAPISLGLGRSAAAAVFMWCLVAEVAPAQAQAVDGTPPQQEKEVGKAASEGERGGLRQRAGAGESPGGKGKVGRKGKPESDAIDDEEVEVDPRAVYNDAVALLVADKLDEAEERLSLARRRAGTDGPARFRSAYNLGWVEIKRADGLIKDQPQQALAHLHGAADWFREAVRLEPGEAAPRRNLEIVARRVIALADSLASAEELDLAARLDGLIKEQRELVARLRATVQHAAGLDQPFVPEHLRSEFRGLEVEQRKVLAQADEVAEQDRREAERLEETPKEDLTVEQNVRLAQLSAVQGYLFEAGQRFGQARRHLRGRQAQRSYRRAAAGLDRLKRARDQLRDLVEILGEVIADAMSLTRQTAVLAESAGAIGPKSTGRKHSWLTRDYLEDALLTIRERTDELVARVEAGLVGIESESDAGPDDSTGQSPSPNEQDKEHLRALLKAAAPLVREGRDAYAEGVESLRSERIDDTYRNEARGTALLLKARELFLDVRGLIEVMYADELRMKALLDTDGATGAAPMDEVLPLLGQMQSANTGRAERLAGLIDRQLRTLDGEQAGADEKAEQGADDPDRAVRRQQFELARQVLSQVMDVFGETQEEIDRRGRSEERRARSEECDTDRLRAAVDLGVERSEALRRLFFSVIEHLKETARRQVNLSDETRDAAALTDDGQLSQAAGPLALRQQELSSISRQIAESLKRQSEQNPGAVVQGEIPGAAATVPGVSRGAQDPGAAQASQDAAHRLLQASGRVGEAAEAMDQALEKMRSEPVELEPAREHQTVAVQKLLEALELLEPPRQPRRNQEQDQQGESPQGEDQQQEGGEQDKQQQPQPQPGQMDMSHLLQAVRDREAQRQRDKQQRQPAGYSPVEKDW